MQAGVDVASVKDGLEFHGLPWIVGPLVSEYIAVKTFYVIIGPHLNVPERLRPGLA